MTQTQTDCSSEEGTTVGLVDAIISIARVLARRRFSPPSVKEALCDLRSDADVRAVMGFSVASTDPESADAIRLLSRDDGL